MAIFVFYSVQPFLRVYAIVDDPARRYDIDAIVDSLLNARYDDNVNVLPFIVSIEIDRSGKYAECLHGEKLVSTISEIVRRHVSDSDRMIAVTLSIGGGSREPFALPIVTLNELINDVATACKEVEKLGNVAGCSVAMTTRSVFDIIENADHVDLYELDEVAIVIDDVEKPVAFGKMLASVVEELVEARTRVSLAISANAVDYDMLNALFEELRIKHFRNMKIVVRKASDLHDLRMALNTIASVFPLKLAPSEDFLGIDIDSATLVDPRIKSFGNAIHVLKL